MNCTLLDAKLLTFSGSISNDQTFLKWSSQNEGSLKQYEVEKSLDGIKFYKTGIVASVDDENGAEYSFVDPEPVAWLLTTG